MIRHETQVRPKPELSLTDFLDILESFRDPVLLLDGDFRVIKANWAFYQTFKLKPDEAEGRVMNHFSNHAWNIPRLRNVLENIRSDNCTFDNFEVDHTFATIGRKKLRLNIRCLGEDAMRGQLIFISIADVTDQEDHQQDLEKILNTRTAELVSAGEEAETGRRAAESDLAEIHQLKVLLEAERAYLQEEIKLVYNHDTIIGHSNGLKYVLYKIEQIAASNTTVLILGETGTGKELVARAIHGLCTRKKRALIKVNCAALPTELIESELFGHEKGAFTGSQSKRLGRFEVADGSTLFLDEIGEMPLELQAKLLRVVQDGEFERLGGSRTIKVNTRIIAATNRNLDQEVRSGNFREDLWYRLNVFPITMPPLRDRRDDIPLLVAFYLEKIAKQLGKYIDIVPESVMSSLQKYHWPGNVRELENVLERAMINSPTGELCLADDLKKPFKGFVDRPKTLAAVERDHIVRVLEQTMWQVSGRGGAAEILDLDRSTLRARMGKLNICKPAGFATVSGY